MADRKQLYEYLGNVCANCGLSVTEMVERFGSFNRMFELNHVDPAKKDDNYTNLIRRKLSAEQLDEVDKCVLLCRNCHGALHSQAIDGQLQFRVEVDGKTAEQTISGQMIVDNIARSATFLSDEPLLVVPYWVKAGESDRVLLFGVDLKADDGIIALLRNLRETRKLLVTAYHDNRIMFDVTMVDEDHARIKSALDFPLFELNPATDNKEKRKVWVRNGYALYSDGTLQCGGTSDATINISAFLENGG